VGVDPPGRAMSERGQAPSRTSSSRFLIQQGFCCAPPVAASRRAADFANFGLADAALDGT